MNTPKWQRVNYMPVTPLYPGQPRVTESEAHRALARKAAGEGMVLLKNNANLLPFAAGTRLAVFGKAQIDYVKGGGGSGDTTVSYIRSIVDGLNEKAAQGKVVCFDPLRAFYAEDIARQYAEGKQPGLTKEPLLPAGLVTEARAFTDTAIITICRFSGEAWDRTGNAYDGDYFLSHEEEAMVEQVRAAFPRIVVVLNTGGMMDTLWFKDDDRIGAALLAWQGGMEGGSAIADVLCGDVCPSGHLADTFAVNFAAYPSSANFNESADYVEYEDDIYVGYRYFETVPGAAEKVCYPFGFGLSYTSFAMTEPVLNRIDDAFTFTVKVTNTGSVAGREVVQLYGSAPQGVLGKPARVLVGFAKTALLQPGECEQISISFTTYQLASYDDVGKVCKSAYILEADEYSFYYGNNVRDAQKVSSVYTVAETTVVEQLAEKCPPHDLKRRLCADGTYEDMPAAEPSKPRDDRHFPSDGQRPLEWAEEVPGIDWDRDEKSMPFVQVANGKLDLDAFIDMLSDKQLVHMLGGQPNRGAANTFGWGNLPLYGVPNVMTADGPAGLRIRPEAGVHTTAFPCACLLACTWDVELNHAIGVAAAEEVLENGIGIWLAPAINIHRSPLCGRNFEYYSEDPLLAGKMAASMIRGVQEQKVAVSLKHFCCNNKETNRRECDSRLSERALREIYLKAFEICVRESDPWTVMSSYNPVNGTRASQNRDLLTDVLRGEWGFDGVVTTDWYTHGEQWREIAAGNDIKMGRGDDEYTLQMIHEGKLSLEDVRLSVKRLLKVLLRLA